jgi:hypothetical protein
VPFLALAPEHRDRAASPRDARGAPRLEELEVAVGHRVQERGAVVDQRAAAQAGEELVVAQGREVGGQVAGREGDALGPGGGDGGDDGAGVAAQQEEQDLEMGELAW